MKNQHQTEITISSKDQPRTGHLDLRFASHAPFWEMLSIPKCEKKYNAIYIGDFALPAKSGGFTEQPAAVFYAPNPDVSKGHKHLFGIFILNQNTMTICDASAVAEMEWNGVIAQNGEVLISTYRHDCKISEDQTAMVDGGQDYIRFYGEPVSIKLDVKAMAEAAKSENSIKKEIQININSENDIKQ